MVHRPVVLRAVVTIALSIALLPSVPGTADVRAVGLGPLRVVSMASGDLHTCAILDTGQVSCWGQGFNGQLGTGENVNRLTPSPPIELPGNARATQLALSFASSCALLDTGQVSCWGSGFRGQLGTGDTMDRNTPSPPIALPAGTSATMISAIDHHVCVVLDTGQVSCWGSNIQGQLGTGDRTDLIAPSAPVDMPAGTSAVAVAASYDSTCALLDTGQVTCWGSNRQGQLGTGDNVERLTPGTPIGMPDGAAAVAITGGDQHVCALLDTGRVACWGIGGQLGTGDDAARLVPTLITLPGNASASVVDAAAIHTCAVLEAGGVSCWGNGTRGKLGTGDAADRPTPSEPIQLPTGTTAVDVIAANDFTCAILDTGGVACWGLGDSGRLGNGGTDDLSSPTLATFRWAEPTLALAAGQASPSNRATVELTATFDVPVTGFGNTDVQLGGTAGATTATVAGSGPGYTVTVSGMTQDGTITVDIPAGDLGPDGNTAAETVTLVHDTTGPTATVDLDLSQSAAVTATPITFVVSFDEPVTGFDPADLTLSGTAGAALTATTIAGTGADYTVTVASVPDPGTVTLGVVAGGVTDTAGNPSGPTLAANDTVTITDVVGPELSLPDDIEVVAAPGATSVRVDYVTSAVDPDSTVGAAAFSDSILPTCDPASGSDFPIGTTVVTCTASDSSGNTSTGTFTVTVAAQSAPTATPPVTMPDPDVVLPATGSDAASSTAWWAGLLVTLGVVALAASRRRELSVSPASTRRGDG